jgi:threonine/homoserine efflux transporter RhtA
VRTGTTSSTSIATGEPAASVNSESGDSIAKPVIGSVTAFVGLLLIIGAIIFIVLFRRRRGKRLIPPDFEKLAYGVIPSTSNTSSQVVFLKNLQQASILQYFN